MKKTFLRWTVFGVGCAALAGMVGCGETTTSGIQKQGVSGQSLYAKYGGAPFVTKVVNDSATAVLTDCTQNPYFTTALNTPGHATTDRLLSCLDLQFTAALGGPATYPGVSHTRSAPPEGYDCKDMASVHAGLGIPSNVFDGFVTNVAGVMKADGMSDMDIAKLAPALIGLKPQIVAPEGQTTTHDFTPTNPPNNGCTH